MDKILDTVRARQMEFFFPADSSPEAVAAHLVLNNRALFKSLRKRPLPDTGRLCITSRGAKKPGFHPPANLAALEKTLNSWYKAHQRARSARIFWRSMKTSFGFMCAMPSRSSATDAWDLKTMNPAERSQAGTP